MSANHELATAHPSVSSLENSNQLSWAANLPRERLIRTATVDCGVSSAAEAERALDAFGQWFWAVPRRRAGTHHVMLKGSVDRLWHAAILNTTIYRALCEEHLGYFLDHHPRDDHPSQTWVQETVESLVSCYGEGLSPLLSAWSPTTMARLATRDSPIPLAEPRTPRLRQ